MSELQELQEKHEKLKREYNKHVSLETHIMLGILRDSFPGAWQVFTQGGCFELYRILKHIHPTAEAWWDGGHVWTKLGDTFYDIYGVKSDGKEDISRMDPDQIERAHNWKYKRINYGGDDYL